MIFPSTRNFLIEVYCLRCEAEERLVDSTEETEKYIGRHMQEDLGVAQIGENENK